MECDHGWRNAADCDACTLARLAPKSADRIAVLEDAIRYGCDMIVGGFPMEAALEMDRRLADPEFDMFRERTP